MLKTRAGEIIGTRMLRFGDLKARGIVNNRVTLGKWIKDPRVNFPKGILLGPNTVAWYEHEISRPLTDGGAAA